MGRVSWSRVVLILVVGAFVVQAAEENTKSTANNGKAAKAQPTGQPPQSQGPTDIMETVDYVRSGALLIGMIAVNLAGRDTWLLAEVICCFAFGVASFFFPDAIFGYLTEGKLDVVHLAIAQAFGAMAIGGAVTIYCSKESRDRSVFGSIVMARILGGAVLLQAMVIDYMKARGDKQRLSEAHLTFLVFGMALWTLGALYQYLRCPSYGSGGVNLKDRLTKHLLFDLLFMMPTGLYMFAFPDFHLANITMKGFMPDGIHAHQLRTCGAVAFMSALHCHAAMGFSDDIDKRAHLMGRLVTQMMIIPTQALYQYKYGLVPMNFFYVMLCIQAVVTLNPLCAYLIRSKSKRS